MLLNINIFRPTNTKSGDERAIDVLEKYLNCPDYLWFLLLLLFCHSGFRRVKYLIILISPSGVCLERQQRICGAGANKQWRNDNKFGHFFSLPSPPRITFCLPEACRENKWARVYK